MDASSSLAPAETGADHTTGGKDARWLYLIEVIEQLSSIGRFEDICGHVAGAARHLVGADGITFVLREDELCHYIEENSDEPLWKGQRFPIADCISGWCMLNGSVAIVPNVHADPRIPQSAYQPTFVRSLIMVPIGIEEPIGAIGAYWCVPRAFDTETVMLLEVLARSTASLLCVVQLRALLSQAEQRMLKAHEIGGLGSWNLYADNLRLQSSLIFRSQLGRSCQSEVSYKDLLRQFHPEDREAFRAAVARANEHGEPFNIQCRVSWADGSEHWLDLHADVVRDTRGQVSHLNGVSANLSSEQMGAG